MKVLDDEGSGSEADVIAGIEWATLHGANVINLSLGGPGGGGMDALAEAVDTAVQSGVLVVVAAGNSGPDFGTVGSPGDARLALTVGASDNKGNLAGFSSRGPTLDGRTKPDVVAPGVDIHSAAPGGSWQYMSGTSMATPHVAGIGALLYQATHAEPLLIKEGLKKTAADLGMGPNNGGAGFVQPAAALEYIRSARQMVRQEVYPGEIALYDFTLQNQGNVEDRFDLTQWFDDNGLKFMAQPSLPASAVQSRADGRIGSGGTAVARAAFKAPDDWAGMEDTVYLFHLTATSRADRTAIDEERATVKVKATKRSMAEYVRTEAAGLSEQIAGLSAPSGVKADLLNQADALAAQVQRAAGALAGRDEAGGNAALDAAAGQAASLSASVTQRQQSGQIPDGDARNLQGRIRSIREHLTTAQNAAMRP